MTWTTPLQPVKPDEMMAVFHSDDAGVYEWICGWAIAHELLNGGMTRINGRPCRVHVVDRWPELGGIHLRAQLVDEQASAALRRTA